LKGAEKCLKEKNAIKSRKGEKMKTMKLALIIFIITSIIGVVMNIVLIKILGNSIEGFFGIYEISAAFFATVYAIYKSITA